MSDRSLRRPLPDRQVPEPEPPRPVATHRCLRCLKEFAVPEEGSCAVYAGVEWPICIGCEDRVRPLLAKEMREWRDIFVEWIRVP